MSDPSARTFTSDFKRFFLRGLVVLLPSVLTLWLVYNAYKFVDKHIADPINQQLQFAMGQTANYWSPLGEFFDPTTDRNEDWGRAVATLTGSDLEAERVRLRHVNITAWWEEHWYTDLIGLVVAVVVVYIAGRLLGGFFGRRIYRRLERFFTQIPVFKQVYPYVKQIVDFLFSDDQPIKFNRVVAVQYPRVGIWSVGFLTGGTLKSLREKKDDAVTVFIPSSPTPFTGYTITVSWSEIVELPLSVEEALRFAVSGGVLVPDHQQAPGGAPPPPTIEIPSGLIPLTDEATNEAPRAAEETEAEGDTVSHRVT
ncbi:MAG: DUF502 domain-containing protein [Planctomycetes bacterium]|nr:DUF502 domain-containing protein [Planctomycetota bacterium]